MAHTHTQFRTLNLSFLSFAFDKHIDVTQHAITYTGRFIIVMLHNMPLHTYTGRFIIARSHIYHYCLNMAGMEAYICLNIVI